MFSFRKIVSSLVLVSYIKLVIASSFAVEAEFQKASRILKVSIDRTVDARGNSTFLDLRVVKQDRATGKKEDLSSAQIDVEEQLTTGTIVPMVEKNNLCSWFEWTVPEVGLIKVDLAGNIVLDNVHYLSNRSILKIKTENLITLQNCTIPNLQLSSHGSTLMGGNRVTNLKAKHAQNSGIASFKGTEEKLKNLSLKRGEFRNDASIQVASGGLWDLGGGRFFNQGKVGVEGDGHSITHASVVENNGDIEGTNLSVQTGSYINRGTSNLNKHTIEAVQNIANAGRIETKDKGSYTFGGHFANDGEIISQKTYKFESLVLDAPSHLVNNGRMQARLGKMYHLNLLNNQTLDHQKSLLQNIALSNDHTMTLGIIDWASTVRSFINIGQLSGSGKLAVDQGQNSGQLDLSRLFLTVNDHFVNERVLWISQIEGKGTFINRAELQTDKIHGIMRIDVRRFESPDQGEAGATITGRQLQFGPNLKELMMGDQTQLLVQQLYISAAPQQDTPLILRGVTHCDWISNKRKGVSHAGRLRCEAFDQQGGEFTFNGVYAYLGKTELANQATFVNHTKASFKNITLTNATLRNEGECGILGQLDEAEQIQVGAILGSGTFINNAKLFTPDKGRLVVKVGTFENTGTSDKAAEITGQEFVIAQDVVSFTNGNHGQILTKDFTVETKNAIGHTPIHNRGEIQAEVATLGRSVINHDSCEFGTTKLHSGAKLTNKEGAELDIGLLIMPGGMLRNEGVIRAQTLDGESLEEASLIENSGRLELSHTLQHHYADLDGRILALILNNTGQFIAHNKLTYDYFRVYCGPYLSPLLNRGLDVNISNHLGYSPSKLWQKWFIKGSVSAPYMAIKHLPLTDDFLRTLSQTHIIDENTTWDTWIYGRFYHSIISHSHDLSSLGHLFLEGWIPSATLTFSDDIITKGLTLSNFDHISIKKSLRATTGDIEIKRTNTLTVGVDNDHMGEMRAEQGEIDVKVKDLINAKYGSIQSRLRNYLEATEGTIELGDKIFVPAHEVRTRVTPHASLFLGGGRNYNTSCPNPNHDIINWWGFYLPNGSQVGSQESQLILKAKDSIKASFCGVQAHGLDCEAPEMDFQNVSFILTADSLFKGRTLKYHRTENRQILLDSSTYGNYCQFYAHIQTSHVTKMFVLGSLRVEGGAQFLGVDALISGDLIYNNQTIRDVAAMRSLFGATSYAHYNLCWERSPGGWFFSQRGTSGGNIVLGQTLSLNLEGELSVDGGTISAQHIRANLSVSHLQALMAAVQRAQSQITRLDTETEVMAQGNPLINQTDAGRWALGTGQSDPLHRPANLPFFDPLRGVLTLNLPRDIAFRMDPTLEALSLMHHSHRTTGRIYDNQGNSGVGAYNAALSTGEELATLEVSITPQVLETLNTFLLFYEAVNHKGQRYLVPQAYVPQTLEEDRIQRSGSVRATTNHTTAETSRSIGGTVVATDEKDALILDYGTQEARSAHIPGVGPVRSAEISEHGNIHKAIHTPSVLTDHDSRAKGTHTLRADADLTLTNSTLHAGERTAVQVDGLLTAASSSLTADKGPTVVKAKALNAQTLIETIYTDSGYYQRAQRQTAFGSAFEKLFMHIETDALANGVSFYGTAVDIKTGGSREFGTIPLFAHSQTKWKKKTVIEDSCHHLRTTVTVTAQSDREVAQAPVNFEVPIICQGRDVADSATFYEVAVPGANNDCGFNCLAISREEALEELLDCKERLEARQIVAPEIKRAFTLGDLDRLPGFTSMPAYQSLKAQEGRRLWLETYMQTYLRVPFGLTTAQSWKDAWTSI
jgi:hypothetical protein